MKMLNLLASATLITAAGLSAQAPTARWQKIAPDLFARSYTINGLRHTQFRAFSANGSRAYARLLRVHHPALAEQILLSISSVHLKSIDTSTCLDWFAAKGTSSSFQFSFHVHCPESEGVIHGTVDVIDVPVGKAGHWEDSAAINLIFSGGKGAGNPQKPIKGDSGVWSATESWWTDGGQSGGECVTGPTGDGDMSPCNLS